MLLTISASSAINQNFTCYLQIRGTALDLEKLNGISRIVRPKMDENTGSKMRGAIKFETRVSRSRRKIHDGSHPHLMFPASDIQEPLPLLVPPLFGIIRPSKWKMPFPKVSFIWNQTIS